MIGFCRHALTVPGALHTWGNDFYRGLTCSLCLPEGGVHAVLAERGRKEELWLYLLAKLFLTPRGRALFRGGGPEEVPPPDPEGREVALVRVTPCRPPLVGSGEESEAADAPLRDRADAGQGGRAARTGDRTSPERTQAGRGGPPRGPHATPPGDGPPSPERHAPVRKHLGGRDL